MMKKNNIFYSFLVFLSFLNSLVVYLVDGRWLAFAMMFVVYNLWALLFFHPRAKKVVFEIWADLQEMAGGKYPQWIFPMIGVGGLVLLQYVIIRSVYEMKGGFLRLFSG